MAGRPTKYTEEVAAEIVKGVSAGLTNKDAALVAGIHETTLITWVKRYPNFANQLTRARAKRSRDLLAAIQSIGATDRDWRALAEVLDRTAPDYRKVQRTEQAITFDVRKAAERVAAELNIPVDVVLSESTRWAEDDA